MCWLSHLSEGLEGDRAGIQGETKQPHAMGLQMASISPSYIPDEQGASTSTIKGIHSLVLLAMVDADYKFKQYDISAAGPISDAQIFNYSIQLFQAGTYFPG